MMKGFQDLYVTELQEARSFEAILTKSLPKLAEAMSDPQLKEAVQEHLETTKRHLADVETILRRFKADPAEHKDQSMERLVEQAQRMAELIEPGPVRDAALIAAAQRIEHYEIAVYGTLKTYAQLLGFDDDGQILSAILEQERDADDELTDLAEGLVNPAALEAEVGQAS